MNVYRNLIMIKIPKLEESPIKWWLHIKEQANGTFYECNWIIDFLLLILCSQFFLMDLFVI